MSELRSGYHDPESGCYIQPSLHNVPNRTFQKARRRYLGAAKRYFARHGRCFDDKMLLI